MIADDETLDETAQPLLPEEQQDAAFYRDVLLDITDAARDFAKLLLTTAQCAAQQGAPPDDILRLAAFDRTSRSARRAILLARHVKKPVKPAAERQPGRQPRAPSPRASAPDPSERQTDIRDRLDTLDSDAALARQPLPAAIADLKRDLTRVFNELSKPIYKARSPEHLHRLTSPTPSPGDDIQPDLAPNTPIPDH